MDEEDADIEFRIAALWVELEIVRCERGTGSLETAARWLEMLKAGDYSFVPSPDGEADEP
ncbi:MAG: hypothetical protein JOY66_06460 [Acetobacteraceae bacterium]|nr:hypothetical protein [Acetobacteraceae bacterium]